MPFRQCIEQDFTSNGIKFENEKVAKLTLNARICPDLPKDDSRWRVMNSYTNEMLRHSFSIMLIKCNPLLNSKCKNETEIEALLKKFYMTVYVVTDEIVYNEEAEVQLIAKDRFFL